SLLPAMIEIGNCAQREVREYWLEEGQAPPVLTSPMSNTRCNQRLHGMAASAATPPFPLYTLSRKQMFRILLKLEQFWAISTNGGCGRDWTWRRRPTSASLCSSWRSTRTAGSGRRGQPGRTGASQRRQRGRLPRRDGARLITEQSSGGRTAPRSKLRTS